MIEKTGSSVVGCRNCGVRRVHIRFSECKKFTNKCFQLGSTTKKKGDRLNTGTDVVSRLYGNEPDIPYAFSEE